MNAGGIVGGALVYISFFKGSRVFLPKLTPPIAALISGIASSIFLSLFFLSHKKKIATAKGTSTYPFIGIANPSCNCWLNALMQFSYHIPRFQSYLKLYSPEVEDFFTNYENAAKQNQPVDSEASSRLRKRLVESGMNISAANSKQEDASEAFLQLFGNVPPGNSLLSTVHRTRYYATRSVDGSPMRRIAEATSKVTTKELPILNIPLQDSLPFSTLIQKVFTRTLHEPEENENVRREGKDLLPHVFPLTKETISYPSKPPFFLISLNRFSSRKIITPIHNRILQFFFGKEYVSLTKRKVTREIDVPLRLRFSSFFGFFSTTYHLQACILHKGNSMNSGHYEAFVRKGKSIYHCNDSTVTKTSEEDMLAETRAHGYFLYYEKK